MMLPLAAHRREREAFFGAAGARSAGQLSAHAEAIAAALPGDVAGHGVVLACADRYHFAAGLLGIWQRGALAMLPANPQPETVRALARSERVMALLHDREDGPGLDVRKLERTELSAAPPHWRLLPNQPALTAFTSGSTGQPVAHVKSFGQLLGEAGMWLESFGLANRRIMAAVSPHHLYGLLFGVLVPLLGGGAVSRESPLLPADLSAQLRRFEARVLVSVPPHLQAFAGLRAEEALPLEHVFSSAAPLPPTTDSALRARGLRVTQVLGSTEAGGVAWRDSFQAPWRALPGVELRVDADASLLVRSAWAATAPSHWIRTGDRVEWVHAQTFRHLGRVDAVVKVGGRRVDLGELEARLCAVTGVRAARVLAAEEASLRGTELRVVVEADAMEVDTLKRALAPHVDPVVLPRRFRIVKALPRNPAGKVSHAALLALFDAWQLETEELADGSIRVAMPPTLGYFRGHFPSQPVLAGVVQLERIALSQARRRWPDLGAVERVTRVKFKRPITPGGELVLTLERKRDLEVQFALAQETEPASSGILHFRAPRRGAEETSSC